MNCHLPWNRTHQKPSWNWIKLSKEVADKILFVRRQVKPFVKNIYVTMLLFHYINVCNPNHPWRIWSKLVLLYFACSVCVTCWIITWEICLKGKVYGLDLVMIHWLSHVNVEIMCTMWLCFLLIIVESHGEPCDFVPLWLIVESRGEPCVFVPLWFCFLIINCGITWETMWWISFLINFLLVSI
jgi:hypothetical protein